MQVSPAHIVYIYAASLIMLLQAELISMTRFKNITFIKIGWKVSHSCKISECWGLRPQTPPNIPQLKIFSYAPGCCYLWVINWKMRDNSENLLYLPIKEYWPNGKKLTFYWPIKLRIWNWLSYIQSSCKKSRHSNQARSQDLEKGGGYFERMRSVQTTLTRIFIDLKSVSDGLSKFETKCLEKIENSTVFSAKN